jgi:hypothetical protein
MRTARDLAQYSRAEAWFHRSVGLARQCRDWDTYVRAYLAHGTMMRRRGALPAARRSYLKALRRATRQGLSETRSMTLHDLFVLEEYASNREAADAVRRKAADSYGSGHRSLPYPGARRGGGVAPAGVFRGLSLKVLRSVFPTCRSPHRPIALGSLARCSAGVGDVAAFSSVPGVSSPASPRAPASPKPGSRWPEARCFSETAGRGPGRSHAAARIWPEAAWKARFGSWHSPCSMPSTPRRPHLAARNARKTGNGGCGGSLALAGGPPRRRCSSPRPRRSAEAIRQRRR